MEILFKTFVLISLLLLLSDYITALSLSRKLKVPYRIHMSYQVEGSYNKIVNIFPNSIPLCLNPTSTDSVMNDPTAGMSSEEIQSYMSNIGGGLCGNNEAVQVAVGLALNVSLLVFAILIISYALTLGTKLVLKQSIQYIFKERVAGLAEMKASSQASSSDTEALEDDKSSNRDERRLKRRVGK